MSAVLRALFGYLFLVLMVRIAGRRPGKQITPYEFVFIFFIGGLTLTPMVGDDKSLLNALVEIITVATAHFFLAWLKQRYSGFAQIMDGTPVVLLNKGEWQVEIMNHMRITDDDVMAMARDSGLMSLEQIEYAVLERNGEISIIAKEG